MALTFWYVTSIIYYDVVSNMKVWKIYTNLYLHEYVFFWFSENQILTIYENERYLLYSDICLIINHNIHNLGFWDKNFW